MATFTGTSGADSLTGTSGADVLFGRQGNDTLRGSGGADFLYGGIDADQLYGGAGDDHLDGQSGKDALYGGDGSDTLLAGVGDDRLEGGGGNDLFVVDNTAYSGDDVIVDFGSGDLILTSAKLADSDNDGIIPVDSVLKVHEGSTVAINNGGTDVTSLTFVGTRQLDSATYYAYSSAGATPPNQPPIAAGDSATTLRDQAVTIMVLANDSDPDGNPLTVGSVFEPEHGTARIQADGSILYTPALGFTGEDSFTYTINDGKGGTATATIDVTISPPPNTAPVAADDSATTLRNAAVSIPVLGNDSDADGDQLVLASVTAPARGTAAIQADGSILYTPGAGFTGEDSFTYTVSDGQGVLATATVAVTVSAPPPPVTVTFSQSARDTSIRVSSPDAVSATATALVIDSGGNLTSQTLLAFEGLFGDGPGQIPLGATIASASLTLTTVNNSATGASFHRMLVDWTDQATWNSLGGGVQFGTEAVATADFNTGAVRTGAAAYDMTASLQAWLAGADSAQEANAANNGWLVATDATDAWHFLSSEVGSGMPVLTVTYSTTGTPPPPPDNAPPAVDLNGTASGTGHTATFTAGGTSVRVADTDAAIIDSDDANLERLTVAIRNAEAGDQLLVSGTLPGGISVASGSTASTLILTGSASKAAYQTALTQVRFDNSSGSPDTSDRWIDVTANDGLATSIAAVATIEFETPGGGGNIIRVPVDYQTIQEAVNAAQNGDTILVAPGTYAGNIDVAGKSITISSYYEVNDDPSLVDQTIISGGSPGIDVKASAPNVVIKGFHFTNSDYGVVFNAPGGQALDNFFDDVDGDQLSFEGVGGAARGNRFFGAGDDSIDVDFVNGDVLIADNIMTSSRDDGIEIRNGNYTGPLVTITMRDNIIVGSGEDGIQLIDYDQTANRRFIIENNLIRDSRDVGLGLMADGRTLEDASGASMPERIHVFNNTFDGNTYGITGGDNLVAVNNIISNSAQVGIKNTDGSSIVSHTLFFGNAVNHSGSNVDASTTINGNPLYTGSFELQPGSPAIDAGANSFVFKGETVLTILGYNGSSADLGWSELLVQQSGDIVLTLDPSFRENVAGAVVGTLSVADSPPGESYVFSVTDPRFQVLGNQLTLSEGVHLDFERTPTVPLNVTATDSGGQPITDTVTAFVANVPETRFAAFGDYANHAGTPLVAQLVDALGVDFIITTGDNVYGAEPIDDQIGRYYSEYIGNYTGAYGPGSPTHRFFPSLGNHEYSDDAGGTNASAYLSYFTLPGNERYYDFVQGPVHFFAVSSNSQEPDGITSSSVQAQWLQNGLANSASPYNIVYLHHPPFSSGENHGSTAVMQWPFEQWGATAVLSGHDHTYERILRDADGDNAILPYFVTGLGGNSRYDFGSIVAGSVARYNDNWGTMLIQASDESITLEFVSVTGGGMGTVIDSYTIESPSRAMSVDQPGTSDTMLAEDLFPDWRGSVHIADDLASQGSPDWPTPAISESRDWNEAAYSLPQLPDFGTYELSTASGHLTYLDTVDFLV
jgi:Bacterial Ig domain/Calcineurin-like phosphoesterase/RTX calcium-binding nonapeptide repeat (4 copies)/Right handed beta helix region